MAPPIASCRAAVGPAALLPRGGPLPRGPLRAVRHRGARLLGGWAAAGVPRRPAARQPGRLPPSSSGPQPQPTCVLRANRTKFLIISSWSVNLLKHDHKCNISFTRKTNICTHRQALITVPKLLLFSNLLWMWKSQTPKIMVRRNNAKGRKTFYMKK